MSDDLEDVYAELERLQEDAQLIHEINNAVPIGLYAQRVYAMSESIMINLSNYVRSIQED